MPRKLRRAVVFVAGAVLAGLLPFTTEPAGARGPAETGSNGVRDPGDAASSSLASAGSEGRLGWKIGSSEPRKAVAGRVGGSCRVLAALRTGSRQGLSWLRTGATVARVSGASGRERRARNPTQNNIRPVDPTRPALPGGELALHPEVRRCFHRLYQQVGFGFTPNERGAWIVASPDGPRCIDWPFQPRQIGRVSWNQRIPSHLAWIHTHPHALQKRLILGQFSKADLRLARSLQTPAYLLDRAGIWKLDPQTGRISREAGPEWFQPEAMQVFQASALDVPPGAP